MNRHSQVDARALDILDQQTVVEAMNNPTSMEEIELYISMLNVDKAAAMDGLFSEIFRYEKEHMVQIMHQIIVTSGTKVQSQRIEEMVFSSARIRERVQRNYVVISVVLLYCLLPVRSLYVSCFYD